MGFTPLAPQTSASTYSAICATDRAQRKEWSTSLAPGLVYAPLPPRGTCRGVLGLSPLASHWWPAVPRRSPARANYGELTLVVVLGTGIEPARPKARGSKPRMSTVSSP